MACCTLARSVDRARLVWVEPPLAVGRRLLAVLSICLLGACAAPGLESGLAPEIERIAQPPDPSADSTSSPVFDAPKAPPQTVQAPARPLDASALPPFEGQREEVRDPLRDLARIDRTIVHDDLWLRIREGFGMRDLDDPIVQSRTAWYAARPEFLKRVLERARRYLYHIVDEIEKRGLPTELALLPIVESAFNPMAYSRSHASGLWQFIPPTGKRYSLEQNWWYDGRRDILASTTAALEYLRDIYEIHGDWHLALASYNWGENAVARAIAKNEAAGKPTDYLSLSMPAETRNYLPKLQALKNIIANPAPFGIALDPIPNQPYFTAIERTSDLDIQLAAQLAEMSVEAFVELNPGFNRPLMPAAHGARIVLPADKVEVFRANLLKHDGKAPVNWRVYKLRRGESLASVAKAHQVSLDALRTVNGIGRRDRNPPTVLVVPVNGAALTKRLPVMYAPPIPARGGNTYHEVRKGDTLWGIARRYGVSVKELRLWNTIGRLLPGQRLRVAPGG